MRCGEEIELFTSSVMWAVWAEAEYFTHHTRRKFNFDRLLYIVFFMTQIHRVRFISVNREASRSIDFFIIFTFSSHTEYVKRESIVIVCVKKKTKFSPFDKCLFLCLRRQNKPKKNSVCLSVCLSGCTYVRTWTFHVDTITFEGVSGSKQNMVGDFHVWNVGLVLKSKIISWSWSWSWFWTEFWFSQKLCGATPNFLDIFSVWRITFSNEFHSEILILHMILILILKKQNSEKSFRNKTKFHEYH